MYDWLGHWHHYDFLIEGTSEESIAMTICEVIEFLYGDVIKVSGRRWDFYMLNRRRKLVLQVL